MIDLTIWMNFPSTFQADLFRVLTASDEVDLRVIFAKRLPPYRVALGWQSDLAGYAHRFLDERNEIADAVGLAWSQRRRLHIVNGLWAEPGFAAALVMLAAARSKYVIYSEASEPDLLRSPIKKLLRAAFGKLMTPGAAGILSVSRLAEDFYKGLGARQRAIYPFGYFDSQTQPACRQTYSGEKKGIEIIFVGQIIHRKGIDLLIEALAPLFNRHPDLLLTIIGGGEMQPSLAERVKSLGISERVIFEGVTPSAEVAARVARADLLILPSRWDGWGMVVNEAFSVGVPVIVSDRCGAADLVRDGVNGYIFRSEDVSDLRRCLSEFIDKKADWPCFRAAARATGNKISTEQMAPYLIGCLKHMAGASSERPALPWSKLDVVEDVAR